MDTIDRLVRATLLPQAVVALFVRTQCTIGPNEFVEKDALLAAFHEWGARNGRTATMRPAAFGHYLLKACPTAAPRRLRVNGDRVWAYAGLSLNPY